MPCPGSIADLYRKHVSVLAQREARPSSVTHLPETMDRRGELTARRSLETIRELDLRALAMRIGTARTTAQRSRRPGLRCPSAIVEGKAGPLQAHLHEVGVKLVVRAMARAGAVDATARRLGVSAMIACRWHRQMPGLGRRRVRADLSTIGVWEANSAVRYYATARAGCPRESPAPFSPR